MLYIFQSKNNIISINFNDSNNCSLHSLKNKDLVCVNYLLSPFFYAIISIYANTQNCWY